MNASWTQIKYSGEIESRYHHGAVVYGNSMYVFGGKNDLCLADAKVHKYDFGTLSLLSLSLARSLPLFSLMCTYLIVPSLPSPSLVHFFNLVSFGKQQQRRINGQHMQIQRLNLDMDLHLDSNLLFVPYLFMEVNTLKYLFIFPKFIFAGINSKGNTVNDYLQFLLGMSRMLR